MKDWTTEDLHSAIAAGKAAAREEDEGLFPDHGPLPAARRCGFDPYNGSPRILYAAFELGYTEHRDPPPLIAGLLPG